MAGHNQLKKTILEFCGITPERIASFGQIRSPSEKQLQRWIGMAAQLARQH